MLVLGQHNSNYPATQLSGTVAFNYWGEWMDQSAQGAKSRREGCKRGERGTISHSSASAPEY